MTTDDIAGRLIEAQCGWNDAVLQIRHGGACYIIPEIVFSSYPSINARFLAVWKGGGLIGCRQGLAAFALK